MSKPIGGTYTLHYHGVPSVPIDHDAEPAVLTSVVNELVERVSAYEQEAEEAAIEDAFHRFMTANNNTTTIHIWRAAVAWQKSRHPEEDWEVEDD